MTEADIIVVPAGAKQREKILAHLALKGSISQVEAFGVHKIMRLAARIEELRRAGHNIVTEMKKDPAGDRYARYVLVTE